MQNPADAAKEKLAGLFNETDSAQEKKPLSLDDLFKKYLLNAAKIILLNT